MRIRTRTIAVTFVALALVAPGSALAVETLPDAIDDPIAAAEPEVHVVEPAEPVNAVGQDVAAQAGGAEVAGVAGGAEPQGEQTPTATAAPATVAPLAPINSPTGTLPFTGTDSGHLVLLLLVGSLFVSAGIVASLYGAARTGGA